MTAHAPSLKAGHARVFAVAAGLFVIWGLALWLYNSLFFKFGKFFALGPGELAWTLAMFHLAYIVLALPAVAFHRQYGFKLGLLAGLSVFGVGAFLLYLAIIQHSALFFLGAVVVIGACGAWLDTSLNPLAAIAGAPQTVIKRMNVAHAFNGIGLFAAYVTGVSVLGKDYVLSAGATAEITARPYVLVGLGAILLAFLIEQIALPDFASKGTWKKTAKTADIKGELTALLGDNSFLLAALALGAYCAVLTILWTANYKYGHSELPGHIAPVFERGWFWFALGRLAGVVLMRWLDPIRLLIGAAALCLIAIVIAATAGGMVGWIALLAASLFLAITYPTVFGIGLAQHWERLAAAAGLLVVAAGIGNALSSLGSTLALNAFNISPRLVILAALPFEAIVLWFALRARRAA